MPINVETMKRDVKTMAKRLRAKMRRAIDAVKYNNPSHYHEPTRLIFTHPA
jgi:uncharacterized protein YdhG (YjbR/CyaY superfamily)